MALLVSGAAGAGAAGLADTPPTEAPAAFHLEPGEGREAALAPGESHAYSLECRADWFIEIVAEQQGIDVLLGLKDPAGRSVDGIDASTGAHGDDTLLAVATTTGVCRLEVRAAAGASGRYTLSLRAPRPATEADRARAEASAGLARALGLRVQETRESFSAAVEALDAAAPLWRRADDAPGEIYALNLLGFLSQRLGQIDRAQAAYDQALTLASAAGATFWLGQTHANLGQLLADSGEPRRAIEHHQQALAVWHASGNRAGEAIARNDLGFAFGELGDNPRAFEELDQALAAARGAGDEAIEATALHNRAARHAACGETSEALADYRRALELSRRTGSQDGEAAALNNLGGLYDVLGRKDAAADYYGQALTLVRRLGARQWEAHTLQNLGLLSLTAGERERGLARLREALAISREMRDRGGEARRLASLGAAYERLGDLALAQEHLQQALDLRRAREDRLATASSLRALGRVLAAQGETARGEQALAEALDMARALGARALEGGVQFDTARVLARTGRLDAALPAAEAALQIAESLREDVPGDDLRASYGAVIHSYFGLLVDVLMRLHAERPGAGLDRRAFEAGERGRARALLDTLRAAQVDLGAGADTTLVERERDLDRRLSGAAGVRVRLLRRSAPTAEVEALERELRALSIEADELRARLRDASPGYAALMQPRSLPVEALQQELDADTLLLEYGLGDQRSYLWAITREGLTSHVLPARDQIETLALGLHAALARRGEPVASRPADEARAARAARELSRLLLGPVAAQLATARRVVIVADGALHYVPFAALPAPIAGRATRLLERSAVSSLPAASLLPLLRRQREQRPAPPRRLAVFADPVFDAADARVQHLRAAHPSEAGDVRETAAPIRAHGASLALPRLSFTRREARALAGLVAPGQALVALDFDAARERALAPELADFGIVHFATHSVVDDEQPELSGVALSQVDRRGRETDGFVRLADLYRLRLRADLVVLSSCRTAIGKAVPGEGLLSLSRGFMHAGAASVVASLWPVDEAAGARLMTLFYAGRLRDGLPVGEALRRAQLALAREPRWRSPYFWAGFVLQGDWR